MKKYLLALAMIMAAGSSFAAVRSNGPSSDDLAQTAKKTCPYADKSSRFDNSENQIKPVALASASKAAPARTYKGTTVR
jgi:hypothetical protein